jgi:HK97 family phage portal protein
MGFWGNVVNAANALVGKASSQSVGAELLDAHELWGMSDAGIPVNSWTAMYHGPVMAATAILSEDVAKIPFNIFHRNSDGVKKPATEHYLYKLLKQPNNWQTAYEFKEMLMSSLVLRGNAYAVICRNGRGVPQYFVPIHPDRCTLFEAPGGEWFYFVTRSGLHEMAVLREQPMLIPAEDMLHLRWLSQWNSLLGSSRITLAREGVGLSMALEQHQASFAGRGTRPSGILTTEAKLAADARSMLEDQWAKAKAGPRNAGGVAVLEQGLKWQPLGMTMVDAEFMASRMFQLREICRIFNLPPHKLGIEGVDSGPSLVQQDQEYLNGPISGYCERFKAKFEKDFDLDGEETFCEWDYDHFLKADIQTRFAAKRLAVGGPWMTPNESRRGEGLCGVPHGDTVLQQTNMAPLGWSPPPGGAGSGSGSDSSGTPGTGGDGDPERTPETDASPSS